MASSSKDFLKENHIANMKMQEREREKFDNFWRASILEVRHVVAGRPIW